MMTSAQNAAGLEPDDFIQVLSDSTGYALEYDPKPSNEPKNKKKPNHGYYDCRSAASATQSTTRLAPTMRCPFSGLKVS